MKDGATRLDVYASLAHIDPRLSEQDAGAAHEQAETSAVQQVYKDLHGHKETFLPLKRDLYASIHQSDLNRFAQSGMYEDLDALKTKLIAPTDATLSKIDMEELYVKIELRAVLKIKILFMKWFQDLVQNTVYQCNLFDESAQEADPNDQP